MEFEPFPVARAARTAGAADATQDAHAQDDNQDQQAAGNWSTDGHPVEDFIRAGVCMLVYSTE